MHFSLPKFQVFHCLFCFAYQTFLILSSRLLTHSFDFMLICLTSSFISCLISIDFSHSIASNFIQFIAIFVVVFEIFHFPKSSQSNLISNWYSLIFQMHTRFLNSRFRINDLFLLLLLLDSSILSFWHFLHHFRFEHTRRRSTSCSWTKGHLWITTNEQHLIWFEFFTCFYHFVQAGSENPFFPLLPSSFSSSQCSHQIISTSLLKAGTNRVLIYDLFTCSGYCCHCHWRWWWWLCVYLLLQLHLIPGKIQVRS